MSVIPKNVVETKLSKESFKQMHDDFVDRVLNSELNNIFPTETDIKLTLTMLVNNGQTPEEL